MTNTNLNGTNNMTESNVNNQSVSYGDMLRETQQAEFPLLSEVTQGLVDDPLTLMNARADEEGVVVPCALPHSMMEQLPEMMSEPLSLYEDADVRTMLQRIYRTYPKGGISQGEKNVCAKKCSITCLLPFRALISLI